MLPTTSSISISCQRLRPHNPFDLTNESTPTQPNNPVEAPGSLCAKSVHFLRDLVHFRGSFRAPIASIWPSFGSSLFRSLTLTILVYSKFNRIIHLLLALQNSDPEFFWQLETKRREHSTSAPFWRCPTRVTQLSQVHCRS